MYNWHISENDGHWRFSVKLEDRILFNNIPIIELHIEQQQNNTIFDTFTGLQWIEINIVCLMEDVNQFFQFSELNRNSTLELVLNSNEIINCDMQIISLNNFSSNFTEIQLKSFSQHQFLNFEKIISKNKKEDINWKKLGF